MKDERSARYLNKTWRITNEFYKNNYSVESLNLTQSDSFLKKCTIFLDELNEF